MWNNTHTPSGSGYGLPQKGSKNMNRYYTVSQVEDVQKEMVVFLDRDIDEMFGKYSLVLYDRTTKKVARRTFDDLSVAYKLFTEMSRMFSFGLYARDDRFKIFESWGDTDET